jgi:lipoprotein-anchoring transpeptidase ErfK/SrfK
MSRHRAEPPRRRAAPPAGHRRAEPAHPRYGRLAVLGASVSVTGIALLGAVGVLPSVASGGGADDTVRDTGNAAGSVLAGVVTTPSTEPSTQASPPPSEPADTKAPQDVADADESTATPPVPADSGEGKRVVFDQSDQRVWLVDEDESVARTYLVSGSLTDNLDPGTYSVYSRSEQAWGVDDSGTMKYFVRFTEGDAGGAIGFHDIPVDNGSLVQTVAQLGTPQSHGCIRQERTDAIALWEFAPIGTEVDVTA